MEQRENQQNLAPNIDQAFPFPKLDAGGGLDV